MRYLVLVPVLALAGCGVGSVGNDADNMSASNDSASARAPIDCRDLRDDVIRIAKDNNTNIVKIYAIKRIGGTDVEPICTGDALFTDGSTRRSIYFKRFIDEDGDSLVQYSPEPFPEADKAQPGNIADAATGNTSADMSNSTADNSASHP